MSVLSQLLNIAWMTAILLVIRATTKRWPLKPTSAFDKLYVCAMFPTAAVWLVAPFIDLAYYRDAVLLDFAAMAFGVAMANWCIHAWRTMVSR